eukprot:TRINITY_DN30330_c0_g1_i1.p1 TRINITY_DN30330_c0_g1~~TRINITY_DN30330_c0_g1_i1.p1  ORF type:complete len:664 (+),score=102.21 TRINITY_DN30330_c0_g1_i1:76-2067(+)
MGCGAASAKGYWEPPAPAGTGRSSSSSSGLCLWRIASRTRGKRPAPKKGAKEFSNLGFGPDALRPTAAWQDVASPRTPKEAVTPTAVGVPVSGGFAGGGQGQSGFSPTYCAGSGPCDRAHRFEMAPMFVEATVQHASTIPGGQDELCMAEEVFSASSAMSEQPLLAPRLRQVRWRSLPTENQRAVPQFADPLFLMPQASGSASRRNSVSSGGSNSSAKRRDWVEVAASMRKSLDGLPVRGSSTESIGSTGSVTKTAGRKPEEGRVGGLRTQGTLTPPLSTESAGAASASSAVPHSATTDIDYGSPRENRIPTWKAECETLSEEPSVPAPSTPPSGPERSESFLAGERQSFSLTIIMEGGKEDEEEADDVAEPRSREREHGGHRTLLERAISPQISLSSRDEGSRQVSKVAEGRGSPSYSDGGNLLRPSPSMLDHVGDDNASEACTEESYNTMHSVSGVALGKAVADSETNSVDLAELELEPRELAPRDESEANSGTSTPRAPVPLPSENRPWRAKLRPERRRENSAPADMAGAALQVRSSGVDSERRSLPAVLEVGPNELDASLLAEQLAQLGDRPKLLRQASGEDDEELPISSQHSHHSEGSAHAYWSGAMPPPPPAPPALPVSEKHGSELGSPYSDTSVSLWRSVSGEFSCRQAAAEQVVG